MDLVHQQLRGYIHQIKELDSENQNRILLNLLDAIDVLFLLESVSKENINLFVEAILVADC